MPLRQKKLPQPNERKNIPGASEGHEDNVAHFPRILDEARGAAIELSLLLNKDSSIHIRLLQ
jgi:hypothetical protein